MSQNWPPTFQVFKLIIMSIRYATFMAIWQMLKDVFFGYVNYVMEALTWLFKSYVTSSDTVKDGGSIPKYLQRKVAYGESNGHLIDDVTWPRKVKVQSSICLGPKLS